MRTITDSVAEGVYDMTGELSKAWRWLLSRPTALLVWLFERYERKVGK